MQMPVNDGAPVEESSHSQLRAEIEDLKRKLAQQRRGSHDPQRRGQPSRPSGTALWILAVVTVLVLAGAFFAGYLPETSRQTALAKEAREDSLAMPPVNV